MGQRLTTVDSIVACRIVVVTMSDGRSVEKGWFQTTGYIHTLSVTMSSFMCKRMVTDCEKMEIVFSQNSCEDNIAYYLSEWYQFGRAETPESSQLEHGIR